MRVEAEFIVHSIVLDEHESVIFNRKLPSEKDVDLFIDVISEGDSEITVDNFRDRVVIGIEMSFENGRSFADIKSDMKKIVKDLVNFLNEE